MSGPTLNQRLEVRNRPNRPLVMYQRWENLLFLHWRFPAEEVQRTLPPGLSVDTHDGTAWVGVIPFYMRGVRPRGLPAVGSLSNFLETNVRTYVYDEWGRPGVWFYSLDCNQPVAVWLARALMHLPYEHAAMNSAITADGAVDYCVRRKGQDEEARFHYPLAGEGRPAEPGALEFFLIERYLLFSYAARRRALFDGRVWHAPYSIRAAVADVWSDVPLRQAGFQTGGRSPDHTCVTGPVDVRIFAPQRIKP
jgi:uncharacterized protein YqjF (DUF2071 family)